ncbi:MAG: tetratricopeptide repeat protein [Desulfobaccales bacterium]
MHLIIVVCLVTGLVFLPGSAAWAQNGGEQELMELLVKSYDLLEADKLAEAKKAYEEILTRFPDNPLALNNLGALYVRENDYKQALTYLERALAKAKGYKVWVDRQCDVNKICLAFRPGAREYATHDLEPLIAANLDMVKAKAAEGKEGK